jgi:FkbM family methyltransferase
MNITRLDEYIKNPSPIEKELKKLFEAQARLIIFDIGSCEGEDSIKYAQLFTNAKIYAFEPLPKNLSILETNLKKYGITTVEVLPIAISDEEGKAEFYVSSGNPENAANLNEWDYGNKSSSLLAPGLVKDYYSWIKFNEVIEVNTNTLENVCRYYQIEGIDFIHMDVQGAELKVLKGAKGFISKVKAILLEVESVHLYQHQPLQEDIENFMRENKFFLIKDTLMGITGDRFYVNSKYFSKTSLIPLVFKNGVNKKINQFNTILKALKRKATLTYKLFRLPRYIKASYSQCGEDLIVRYIFDALAIDRPSYIDIGAHDPEYFSNTALFYKHGSKGINIEPDPKLFKKFLKKRKKDINLNIGISNSESEADFYLMSSPTLNTFSKAEADAYVSHGYSILSIEKVKSYTLNQIISKYCGGQFPDFLSLDVEGLDFSILNSINYEVSIPIVICVETISFSETGQGRKNQQIIDFLVAKGYMIYADTYINTIFVKKDKWIR